MTALRPCLSCSRHPSTHAPATPDSDESCTMCGLGDELPACPYCGDTGRILDGDTEYVCGSCYDDEPIPPTR